MTDGRGHRNEVNATDRMSEPSLADVLVNLGVRNVEIGFLSGTVIAEKVEVDVTHA